jgi:hypothetical protein
LEGKEWKGVNMIPKPYGLLIGIAVVLIFNHLLHVPTWLCLFTGMIAGAIGARLETDTWFTY